MADELDRNKTMNDEMGRGDDDVRGVVEDEEFEDVDDDDSEDERRTQTTIRGRRADASSDRPRGRASPRSAEP